MTAHLSSRRSVAGAGLLAVALVSPLLGQEPHQHGESGRLGTVKFANSCAAEVQPDFARGMALLHSFEYGPAIDAFQLVSGTDPSCGIAYWGMAVAQWGNPFAAGIKPAASAPAGPRVRRQARKRPARRPRASATTWPRPARCTTSSRPSTSARGCWRTATRWPGLRPPYPDDPEAVGVLRAGARVLRPIRRTRPTRIS